MNWHSWRLRPWIVLAALLPAVVILAPLTAPPQVDAQGQVVPLTDLYAGQSYPQWSAAWWQWADSIPIHRPPCATLPCNNPISHPLVYPTTGLCGAGNSGAVWFLGGVFFSTTDHPPSITRNNCSVPANTALFFPILNTSCSALEVAGGPGNGCGRSPSEGALRSVTKRTMDGASDLFAEIDGVKVDASSYRVQSGPGCFSYILPVDNLLRFFGETVAANTPSGCAVADGYYLLLRPLSSGQHTLHIHGTLPSYNYTLDVVYYPLNVAGGS